MSQSAADYKEVKMAIRYDPGYNKEIRDVVRNFNRKRNRAYAKGFRDLPDLVKVSDLKARYSSREDLNKQLKMLKTFSSGGNGILEAIENQGGATSTAWEFKYLKENAEDARDYFLRQYKLVAKKVGRFPGERLRLENIAEKINFLDMDIKYLDQEQFRSYKATINEYLKSASKQRAGYRGFLAEVVSVMKMVGIEDRDINRVFNKVKELSPSQFFTMYEESDLISRIYELADSPIYTGGTLKLNTTPDRAKELVDTFVEEVDDLVEKAKKEPEGEYDPLNDFVKALRKEPEELPGPLPHGKIAKSTLTPRQIRDLKYLGWDDLIDETK